jgi:hypothetical protein
VETSLKKSPAFFDMHVLDLDFYGRMVWHGNKRSTEITFRVNRPLKNAAKTFERASRSQIEHGRWQVRVEAHPVEVDPGVNFMKQFRPEFTDK